jgi:hypothetical protein
MIKQHQLSRRESVFAFDGEFATPVPDFALFDAFHNRGGEMRFVARVELRRGSNGSYASAARRGCLVGCAIPVRMTWGLLGRVLVLEEGVAFGRRIQGGGCSPAWSGP